MKTNQTSYQQKLTWRIRGLWALIVLMLIYMVVIAQLGGGDSRMMTPLADMVSRILMFGGLIFAGCRIRYHKKLQINLYQQKQRELEEQDERNRWLHTKSGGVVVDVLLAVLLVVTLTASLFDMAAFYVSFGLLLTALALKGGVWLACDRGWMQ